MNSLSPLLSRRERLRISVRFRLRPGQTTGDKPRQLYIRLKVDGTTCADYSSGVYVQVDKWNSQTQKLIGYSKLAQQANQELEAIVAEHKTLLAELMRLQKAGILVQSPTAEIVKQHWTRKTTLVPTLLAAYDQQLVYLRSLDGTPDAREKRTLDKWENGKQHLTAYIEEQKQGRLTADLITPLWAEGYYHWLIKRPLGLASAARYVGYLRASINHLVASQQIARNPIENYYPDKGKDKPVYFLESVHLERLWGLEATGLPTLALVRDWLLLMCYTGMDQPDLERYVVNPSAFEQSTEAGSMILINRGKTDLTACVPLLPEVNRILANYPNGMPTLTNQAVNRWTKIVQEQIGFEERLTTKICRKTAGALFLRLGFRIEEVSKVLGHSSIQTTLRNYVRVTSAMVEAGMRRVQSSGGSQYPFKHMHKAS